MKYIDVKVTVWNRYILHDDANVHEAGEAINDLGSDFFFNELNVFKDFKVLFGTEEICEPVANEGMPTIIIYEDKQEKWNNGFPPG